MALQIVDALSAGIRRLFTRDGLVLAGLFYLLSAVSGAVNAALIPAPAGPAPGMGPDAAPAAGSPPSPEALGAVFALSLLVGLVSAVLTIGALRAFVTDTRLSAALVARNLPLALVNYVVGGIAYGVLVFFGLLLLILPGIFVMVVLAFWTVYVAVEDENFVAAFGDSWRLTEGNRVRLFALGLVVIVVAVLISLPFSVVSGIVTLLGGGTVAQVLSALVSAVGSAVTTVVTLGVVTAAYRQLTGDASAVAGSDTAL